ncbi:MAG: FAD-binding oxidoreductase [bacterium]|nr:FAD-binding oxidoreductase [bacterium]
MLNGATFSYWERKHFFDSCDLIVIGAGITGYSTALHYKRSNPNAKILILERGLLPSGASSKNAGFACFGSPTELADDLQQFDDQTVWDTVALRLEGLRYLEEIIGQKNMNLQINGSWDLIREDEQDVQQEILERIPEFNAALEKISGEKNVYSWDDEVASRFGFRGVSGGFKNRLEGQIDTSKMNAVYYQRVVEAGISVLFGMEAKGIQAEGTMARVETQLGEISAGKVALCTNGFAKQFLPEDDIAPARAQVLITKPIDNLAIEGTFHYQKGYYYFRNIDNRILLGGGRNLDFEGETTTNIATSTNIQSSLQTLLSEVILPNTAYSIDHSWAGIMGVGSTKKPIIKQLETNVFCGVRLGGMGVAIGSLVGKQLAQIMEEA